MSSTGLRVMLEQLFGSRSQSATFAAAIGKTVTALSLGEDDALHFTFEDGSRLKLFDDGQSCCEKRYMRTDDDLNEYVGAKLLGVEVRPAPSIPEEYGEEHDVAFLAVQTDRGEFVMSNHNEHNGYYAGFVIRASSE